MSWSDAAFVAIAQMVSLRTGLCFPVNRQDSAETTMRQAMKRAGIRDPERYRQQLQLDVAAFEDLVGALTIGETYFFRELGQFEFLRSEVLPAVQRQRGPAPAFRAWSAGCASGEEAYSLAMLCAGAGLADHTHVLGTDIARVALARAQAATYGTWSLRGEGPAWAQPYLVASGKEFTVAPDIRRLVTFAYLNLALDVYPSFATGTWAMDVILCRNVLIYLDAERIVHVAQRLWQALAPGGWLLTASSDPPLSDLAPLEAVTTEAGIIYRRSGAEARWPQPAPMESVAAEVDEEPDRSATAMPVAIAAVAAQPLDEAREALRRGDYARAAAVSARCLDDAAAAAVHLRALANFDAGRAERACAGVLARHPLCAELHHLHGMLLMECGREEEAVRKLRQVIFLDRSLAIAHFTLGGLLRRSGDLDGARRAYRNAHALCAAQPPGALVPLTEGEPAGRLADAAAHELALLGAAGGESA